MILKQLRKKSEYGLVINWKFHSRNQWVSIFSPFMVKAIIEAFDPIIISSQLEYELHKKKLRVIISMEPGWAAPKLRYDTRRDCIICIFASDPHNKTSWLEDYVQKNGINYVLSQYYHPFFYHFPKFPEEKLIHFPWAVPDSFLSNNELVARKNEVVIFGGSRSNAYDVRNWCREQEGIVNHSNSGVENKKMGDEEYLNWLTQLDAVVAAGSSNRKYDLVTPKYFEICAAGALLIGQHCRDLETLGFNDSNAFIFQKENFLKQIHEFKRSPEKFLPIRKRGRELIKDRHLISQRVKQLRCLFMDVG